MRPEIRWATPEDVKSYIGDLNREFHGRAAEIDGQIVGMSGYYLDGDWAVVFSRMDDEMRLFPQMIWREAKLMMHLVPRQAICVADPELPGAPAFLERLGWKHLTSSGDGEVYTWNP